MATATAAVSAEKTPAPSREDFAKLLEESFDHGNLQEGSVIKGTVVGIEKDLAVIDVGLKTEGRVALREFAAPGRQSEIKIGD
ncbi:MAG TPA: S1 RNA-binding domain-containing protein, partial [Xanthobacteraceae bacterium]|nr:S1 RNA-binding domain-containing protein [Xanthobacteraceae bacterium]